MRTKVFLLTSLLAGTFLAGCTATEEPVTEEGGKAIRITAGIGETSRAVIDADYASNLDISFARLDNPALEYPVDRSRSHGWCRQYGDHFHNEAKLPVRRGTVRPYRVLSP